MGEESLDGIRPKSEQHFIYGDGIGSKKRGVLGAHNLESFDNTLKSTGYSLEDLKVGDPIPHPMVDGGYLIKGTASNGLEFYGYLRDGEITNFFPSVPE